jgi:internalin A
VVRRRGRKPRGAIVCILLLCSFVLTASAVEVDFPDPALRAAVQSALGLEAQPIQLDDLRHLTALAAEREGISDLTGLDACTALEQLLLGGNVITDLDPVSGLESLRILTLDGNHITDLQPLSHLTALTYLAVHGNPVEDAGPIASLAKLEHLSAGNLIDDITPLAGLTALRELMLYVRPSTDVSPIQQMGSLQSLLLSSGQTLDGRVAFDPVLLTSCPHLITLQLHGYEIARLSDLASAVPSLRELSLHYVGADDLSRIEQFPELIYLTLNGVIGGAEGTTLTRLHVPATLRSLTIQNSGLEDLSPLSRLPQLTRLDVSRNEVTDIAPLEALTALAVLDLSFNPLTDLAPLHSLSGLKSLSLQGVPFDRTEGSDSNRLIRDLREQGVNIIY